MYVLIYCTINYRMDWNELGMDCRSDNKFRTIERLSVLD